MLSFVKDGKMVTSKDGHYSNESVPSIPPCRKYQSEGYKCGYKDGMKRAEIDNK